jgi:uncharacterized protein (TIGR00251 family)
VAERGYSSAIITQHTEGAVLTVWVVPGEKRDQMVGPYGGAFKVRVAVAAEPGRANKALLRQLKGVFGVTLELLSGAFSRTKRVLLPGRSVDEIEQYLDDKRERE